jgi:tetratricopeptide (TPR) repeat protein
MTRKLFGLPGLAIFFLWSSCALEKNDGGEEYRDIFNAGTAGEELIAALEDFEIRHSGHFDSKVDLGVYYLAAGERGRARDYLRRAERVLRNGGAEGAGDGKAAALYGALGQLGLINRDYEEALDYADLAIGAEGGNKSYRFLKGHILIARKEYGAALAIFDEAMAGADDAGADDIRAYMFLLAQAERPADAAAVLDQYLQTGGFFPGLGYFGAMIYRAAGEMEKAAYAAYLEREYRSGYKDLEEPAGGGLGLLGEIPEITEAPGHIPLGGEGREAPEGLFAAEYLFLKGLIDGRSAGNFGIEEFRRLAELEPYFRLFPSFYWLLWKGARMAYPEDHQYFSSALRKIITLDKDGPFARGAWEELTRLMGY